MTPKEYAKKITKFVSAIGSRAHVCTFISDDEKPIRAALYSNWPGSDRLFEVTGDNFAETFAALETKWADYQVQFTAETTRRMALKIIEITAGHGHCTDAALRGGYSFSDEEIKRFGTAACRDANEIAGKGPFEIVTLSGANGAPDAMSESAQLN